VVERVFAEHALAVRLVEGDQPHDHLERRRSLHERDRFLEGHAAGPGGNGDVRQPELFGAEVGVMTSLNDYADRPARGFADGKEFSIGSRRMKWLYTPHVPHGWDCGILFDLTTRTLLCGDLFTQPGANMPAVTESEVLTASEGMRGMMDYYAHATGTSVILERLAKLDPRVLACQHGSAYRGDGAALLRELAYAIGGGKSMAPVPSSVMTP
jgi:hypothetical protein